MLNGLSQNLYKQLIQQPWHFTQNLSDSSPILLNLVQENNSSSSIQFKSDGTCIQKTLVDSALDSSAKFKLIGELLILNYHFKDSTKIFWYEVKTNTSPKTLSLHLKNTLKNIRIGNDTAAYSFLWFSHSNKSKNINRFDNIKIKSKTKNNSDFTKHKGGFLLIKGDTIFLDSNRIAQNYFLESGRDTFPLNTQKIAYSDLHSIKINRKTWNKVMAWGMAASVFSALVISPVISFEGSSFNFNKAQQISSISMAALPVFIGGRMLFGRKKIILNDAQSQWHIW